ncbi:DUF302 domain-containing protein [Meiothermus cerbereus]|uniref:DUF302 domain-containing protein n=1 Tax=Meiothermus cerbereus TaxID=65552 RepID=UPI003EEB1435
MKKMLFGLLVLVLASVALAQTQRQPDLVLVTQSNKSFAVTVEQFKAEVKAAGWSILNYHNMAGVLSEKGFTLHPVLIFDVCSGRYSARILAKDEYRPISALMPCRVSIYQTSDGKVFIARMNAPAFAPMMPKEVGDIMIASSQEIEAIIAKVVR